MQAKISFINKPTETRKAESDKQLKAYPNMVPLIIQFRDANNNITFKKMIAPKTITVTQLMVRLLKIKDLSKNQQTSSLVVKNNSKMINNTSIIGDIYNQKKDQDGWLYLKLQPSNPF